MWIREAANKNSYCPVAFPLFDLSGTSLFKNIFFDGLKWPGNYYNKKLEILFINIYNMEKKL